MIKDVIVQLFGTYQPIDGCTDWAYIGGVAVFCIVLYMVLYALCGVLKK